MIPPVEVTARYRSLRGMDEVWEAVTRDRLWRIERLEQPGTPWLVTHLPTGRTAGLYGSLRLAREAIGDGWCAHAITEDGYLEGRA